MKEVVDFVDKNYAEKITLSAAAKKFGYSESRFSSLFSEKFSQTFTSYVNETRIRKSLKKLGKEKTETLFCDFGFQSPQQYFLNFKKVFGCSPKKYISGKSPN